MNEFYLSLNSIAIILINSLETTNNTLDFIPRYLTHKRLPSKKDLNQDNRDSPIPVERRTFSKIWWFTLSKPYQNLNR